ncbi:hypothetical protein EGP98_00505 [bacterium]|nr:hypothetical protein [bacterium]
MNVEKIKSKLLVKYPFFGSIVANSNFISEPSISTAATDGKNIYYNPKFIETITNEQQIFIFAHEISHIAFNHIYRSEGKDQNLWNIATDAVINASLKQDGLPLIDGVVDIPEAINYDAEELYKKLLDKKKQQQNEQTNNQNKKQSSSDGESSQEQDIGNDTHAMWKKEVEKKHQEEQQSSNNDEEIKKLTGLGEKETFKQNKIERKKQLEELRKALVSQSHAYGDKTNSERRNITDIGTSAPIIDWRRLLKEAVKYDVDWSYQNAGIEDGVVTAYLEEIPRPETEIVLDTSGSINETLLRNFLRECKNILQTSKVKVGCFDTRFYGFTEIKNVSDIDDLPFYGGGDTNFNVAVNAFTRRVENKIIFTDGKATVPSTPMDAIWIVFGDIKIEPAGGKVIYINDRQLENLYNYQMINEAKGKTR